VSCEKGVEAKRGRDPETAAALGQWVDRREADFAARILPVDAPTATRWGELSAERSLPVLETLIAATPLSRGLILVTRNVQDVISTGVTTLNPWA